MKQYLKILVSKLLFVVCLGIMFENYINSSVWANYIGSVSLFLFFFNGFKIQESKKDIGNTILRDGIAGARICCIFVVGMLFPWGIGLFKIMPINILLFCIGVFCCFKGKKHFYGFLQENSWLNEYWYVFCGCTLLISAIYSVLAFYGIAPCSELKLYGKGIILAIVSFIIQISLPPNCILIKFVSSSYKRYH